MSLHYTTVGLLLVLASAITTSSSSIVPFPPIPERDVSTMCTSTLCNKGTVCRVVTACVSLGCFPHATCLPCVPEGVDAICNANRYIYTVLMVKPSQLQSPYSRFTPRICNPTLNNDESGCPKGSVCIASDQSKETGTCCYGKPDFPPKPLPNSLSSSAINEDPICDGPSDLCGEKCPKGSTCLPTKSECGQLTYACKPVPKPGRCPPVPFSNPGFCPKVRVAQLCGTDSDCKGDKKCCKTVCGGSACLSPF